jgi:PAS domain S-box-containing protein
MDISSSVKLYIFLIVIGGTIIISAAGFSLYKASDIQSAWLDFDENRSDKNRALLALRKQIGFGGMIHNFKNYLLRKNLENKKQVNLSLGGAKASLDRYKILSLNNNEINAINIIEDTLLAYEEALNVIDKKINEGKSIREIDAAVKIDDTGALLSIEILSKENSANSLSKSKSYLLSLIRKELGYGGMIHFYKNYILRSDENFKHRARASLNFALNYIDEYSKKNLSVFETQQLSILAQQLNKYGYHLSIIDGLIFKKLNPREIDKQVQINDEPIFESLKSLEQQTIVQLEKRADEVEASISFIVFAAKFIGGMTFLIILLIAAGSFWFVKLRIVNPITSLIKVMGKLSVGDTNVEVKNISNNNEIGDMARSVDTFKEAVKARIDIEEKLSEANTHLEERVIERTQELEDNQKRLKAIVETAVDAIIVIDDKGIINSFNASAVNMFGYTEESVIGENINILVPKNERPQHDNYLSRYEKGAEGADIVGKGREIMAIHKSGKEFPVEITVSELFIENTRMFTGIIRDVSERYFHEEQIRRTQKMDALGKLTGGIAHDYNNMLAVIMGYAEILENALGDNDKLQGYSGEILKAGKRGAKLTNKLLDFSRHKPTKEKNIVNVNSLLSDLESMLKSTLTARINLDYVFNKELWEVNVDAADFENAILNMCINAMHAIIDTGSITIMTENVLVESHLSSEINIPTGEYIKISIVDTGCGMTNKIMEHIFDPFYTTKNDKGTGLGLSQVYGFLQRSNGGIKVYSEVESGTKFELFLPRDASRRKEAGNTTYSETENLKGNETILVVDDEPALVVLADEILTSFGYHVLTATNGIDALAILDQHPEVSFLLSDIIMPEMDGYELASKVKEKFPNVIIQFASGYNSVSENQKGRYEYLEIISKPYSLRKLARKVRELLDSK